MARTGAVTRSSGGSLFELNIDILCANSSQAKGRVERMKRHAAGPIGQGAAAAQDRHA
jgi:hypothetical protein